MEKLMCNVLESRQPIDSILISTDAEKFQKLIVYRIIQNGQPPSAQYYV